MSNRFHKLVPLCGVAIKNAIVLAQTGCKIGLVWKVIVKPGSRCRLSGSGVCATALTLGHLKNRVYWQQDYQIMEDLRKNIITQFRAIRRLDETRNTMGLTGRSVSSIWRPLNIETRLDGTATKLRRAWHVWIYP